MTITKDIITDLLPAYLSGECSADTTRLVEGYLRTDAPFAAEVQRMRTAPLPALSAPDAGRSEELRSLKRTRSLLNWRSALMAFGFFFSLAPFSVLHINDTTYWFFIEAPRAAAVYGIIGLLSWAGYFLLRRRLRGL
ncbi:MAG: zf-HC2 domain-containing protein [Bacteroidetes bacterium]|nr:MAG: zf-HC2 domain-containing protein [Bacteroidota bacterium]